MDIPPLQNSSELTRALARVVEAGGAAVLATLVEAERGVGAKVLFEAEGVRTGTTGDAALDGALEEGARAFLDSRAEARTLRAEELAPGLGAWRGARVLFERVEPEPHLVVCGAGHVGAALARLAHAVGYRVTLVDDREEFVARSRFREEGIELVAAAQGWTQTLTEVV